MARHVLLDALFLDPGVSGGPETVLRELVPAIARERPRLELTVATSRRGAGALRAAGWADFARIVRMPMDDDRRVAKLAAQQVGLPRLCRRLRADVVHSLANLAPVRPPVPLVLTLHDVIALRERTMAPVSRLAISAVVRAAAPRAAVVVTPSEAARQEILGTLDLDPRRVRVIPSGAGRPPGAIDPDRSLPARLGLDGRRVVLSVGAKRRHKNHALLVRALPHLPGDVVLVLAGHDDGEGAALRGLTRSAGVEDRVVQLDAVSDAGLEALYALAACVALPTRSEGFGLPLVEAMARGVPVACSDIAVLREVGGELPAFFGPDDPPGAAAAILAVLGDRARGDRGRERAARYSWTAAARGYLEVYDACTSA